MTDTLEFLNKIEVRKYPGRWVRVYHGFRMEPKLNGITPIFLHFRQTEVISKM